MDGFMAVVIRLCRVHLVVVFEVVRVWLVPVVVARRQPTVLGLLFVALAVGVGEAFSLTI